MVVRRLCALVIALLVVPGLAWGAPQGKVVIAQGVDPTTLDTQNQQETPASVVATHIFDTLVERDQNLKIVPALAAELRVPYQFTVAEHENGKSGWALGASFITEGAIPFAAADPLRVIPAMMAGSAVAGGLSEAFDVGVRAPHGGIFVLFAVINIGGYFIALISGVVVGAFAVIALKSTNKQPAAEIATV